MKTNILISIPKVLILGLAACCAALPSAMAQMHGTGVFRAKLTLPAAMVVTGTDVDTINRKTLKNNDIINLALGRPLSTHVDPKTEILAAQVSFESHSNAPQSQLIIYDSTQNGAAGVRAVVASLDTLEWQNAYERNLNSGFGIARGTINATTLGSPSQNGFLTSSFQGSGTGSGRHLFSVGDANANPKAGAFIQAHLKFVYTDSSGTHTFDGFVQNGTAHISGKPIGGW